jgi:UDP-N-acetylglucosamine:LPS N-acetylglucosamine transferase
MNESRGTLLLVSSHGGHLTELLELAPAFEGFRLVYFCYDADTTRALPNVHLAPNRPYSPWHFLNNFARAWRILRRERVACVVSTGAEIAIPVFLAAWLRRVPRIYIECGAQVETPSMTGRVLSRISDAFFVQWPELLSAYRGRARFEGSLIDELRETAGSAE